MIITICVCISQGNNIGQLNLLLLLGYIQLRVVYPIPNAKDTYLLPCFSASHEVRHLVLPRLLRSSSSPPTVRCPLVNLLWPTTAFPSKELVVNFVTLIPSTASSSHLVLGLPLGLLLIGSHYEISLLYRKIPRQQQETQILDQ